MQNRKNSHQIVISSILLDKIINDVIEADNQKVLSLPPRIAHRKTYGREMIEIFTSADRDWMTSYVAAMGLSNTQLCALDALARWSFRNSSSDIRVALALLSTEIGRFIAMTPRDSDVKSTDIGDIVNSFLDESVWAIRDVLRSASLTGSIDAKIPMTEYSEEFKYLSELCEHDRSVGLIEEKQQARHYLSTTTAESVISPAQMSRREYAARRLFQMLLSASQYKRDDCFSRLRSLLNNGTQLAMTIRRLSVNDPDLGRLATDVLDQFHSVDRFLNANGTAASSLVTRVTRDELVYDEIIAMGRHQHRIIAVEFNSALMLFSYLVKLAGFQMKGHTGFRNSVSDCLRYSGALEGFTSEVMDNQKNFKVT